MERVTGPDRMAECAARWRREGRSVGFVPTMGALHQGHLSLIDRARTECERVVVSIFVNPLQFGPNEDFDRYPRPLEDDLRVVAAAQADVAFTPEVAGVYPPGFQTTVSVGELTQRLCGAVRPGHFDGVTTVVNRLLNLVRPTRAYFGQKDFQQVTVIHRMVTDLGVGVDVVMCPIVREADGLAMSSRNRYLAPMDRERALALWRAVSAGQQAFAAGELRAAPVLARMREILAVCDRVDYAEACDPGRLTPVERLEPGTVLLVAAHVGTTRLIDNLVLSLG